TRCDDEGKHQNSDESFVHTVRFPLLLTSCSSIRRGAPSICNLAPQLAAELAAAKSELVVVQIAFTFPLPPIRKSDAVANVMNAIRREYSTRSCPSSCRQKRPIALVILRLSFPLAQCEQRPLFRQKPGRSAPGVETAPAPSARRV